MQFRYLHVTMHLVSKPHMEPLHNWNFYLKQTNHIVHLSCWKQDIAFKKIISQPRLELNAAGFGGRLYKLIIKEVDLPIQTITFWTNSVSLLQYIWNETYWFKIYVANRVTEIKEKTFTHQWHHIETDICSRDVKSVGELLGETNIGQEWFNGRQLLWNDQESQGSFHLETLLEINDEIKTRDFLVALVATEQLDFVKFEEWKELCSILAYAKRFRNNCKKDSKKLK